MIINKRALAGTLESSDVLVEVMPLGGKREILLESIVLELYGDAIHRAVESTLDRLGVNQGQVMVFDRGAVDCVIQARVETALLRAEGEASHA